MAWILPLLLAAVSTAARLPAVAASPVFEAGVAGADITPREAIRMGGYAARTHASDGVAVPLWAKALALRDARGGRVVIVTLDLLRAPRILTDAVAGEAKRRHGLERSQILFNCSHNHSGPLLWENDPYPSVAPEDYETSRRYMEWLTATVNDLVGEALRDLAPATISVSEGSATFGANRRVATAAGYEIGHNPSGPTDHRVPVLRVNGADGRLRAVLFGYACHNTAIGPESYRISGDYAGVAQQAIERAHPGVTALFLQLAAGDQDPYPRGPAEWADRHGRALADAVERALAPSGQAGLLAGPLGTAYREVPLALAPHTRELFETRLSDPLPARVRNARTMLKAYDEGRPMVSLPYPVQAVRVGEGFAIVAIGGEPVVDYALRAKRELPGVVLAGYSNSVKGYVPSARVLAEGGYEAGDSAIYYGLPGPFAPGVEDTIFAAVRDVLRDARSR